VALVKALGKTPIVVKNSPGFVVNRILCPMINEAVLALQEGLASAEEIDNGMKLGCSHPIGPLALADMVGLDVMLAVMEVFYRDFNDRPDGSEGDGRGRAPRPAIGPAISTRTTERDRHAVSGPARRAGRERTRCR
jgi:hypothetical protein